MSGCDDLRNGREAILGNGLMRVFSGTIPVGGPSWYRRNATGAFPVRCLWGFFYGKKPVIIGIYLFLAINFAFNSSICQLSVDSQRNLIFSKLVWRSIIVNGILW